MKKGKKISGGKYVSSRKKKKTEIAGQKRIIKIGEDKKKTVGIKGGNKKTFHLRASTINVKNGKETKKTKITNVIETPSDRFLARQNIITKGTIVQTEYGKVKITNRPTQEGNINGILIE